MYVSLADIFSSNNGSFFNICIMIKSILILFIFLVLFISYLYFLKLSKILKRKGISLSVWDFHPFNSTKPFHFYYNFVSSISSKFCRLLTIYLLMFISSTLAHFDETHLLHFRRAHTILDLCTNLSISFSLFLLSPYWNWDPLCYQT